LFQSESYKQARALLQKIGCNIKDETAIRSFRKSLKDASVLAAELDCGEIMLLVLAFYIIYNVVKAAL